jgi:hypothetical protein
MFPYREPEHGKETGHGGGTVGLEAPCVQQVLRHRNILGF